MLFGRFFAILLIISVLIAIFREWILIPIGIIVLLYIIRWLADLWWWGKDKGKW